MRMTVITILCRSGELSFTNDLIDRGVGACLVPEDIPSIFEDPELTRKPPSEFGVYAEVHTVPGICNI